MFKYKKKHASSVCIPMLAGLISSSRSLHGQSLILLGISLLGPYILHYWTLCLICFAYTLVCMCYWGKWELLTALLPVCTPSGAYIFQSHKHCTIQLYLLTWVSLHVFLAQNVSAGNVQYFCFVYFYFCVLSMLTMQLLQV